MDINQFLCAFEKTRRTLQWFERTLDRLDEIRASSSLVTTVVQDAYPDLYVREVWFENRRAKWRTGLFQHHDRIQAEWTYGAVFASSSGYKSTQHEWTDSCVLWLLI
ncbi:hypothetical protein MAR_002131 [Mya arenaria]|uniref:Uncharacterized protein n=1 Tax=Mya arenaria TaxID=6604 RepID=A0ABY7FDN7_MYAAR|nr:hypothetical protein MAR_002131 [Mya arenaria]